MLGDADAVGAWRIDDDDAASGGGGNIDIVDAGAGAGDDAEAGSGLEEARVDRGRTSNEERVGVSQIGGKLGRFAARSRINGPTRFGAQQLHRGRRQIVGNNDFQSV